MPEVQHIARTSKLEDGGIKSKGCFTDLVSESVTLLLTIDFLLKTTALLLSGLTMCILIFSFTKSSLSESVVLGNTFLEEFA